MTEEELPAEKFEREYLAGTRREGDPTWYELVRSLVGERATPAVGEEDPSGRTGDQSNS